VWPSDLAPDHLQSISFPFHQFIPPPPALETHPNLGTRLLGLGPVDEGDTLSAVESGLLGRSDTLNLDERGVGVGVALATLVRKVASLKSGNPSSASRPYPQLPFPELPRKLPFPCRDITRNISPPRNHHQLHLQILLLYRKPQNRGGKLIASKCVCSP
jgi:hypothetical protein